MFKELLLKTVCYKAGSITVEALVVFAITGKPALSLTIAVSVSLATMLYYCIFEYIWKRKRAIK